MSTDNNLRDNVYFVISVLFGFSALGVLFVAVITRGFSENAINWGPVSGWFAGLGTFTLATAALRGPILDWWKRPILDANIELNPPNCHKTKMASQGHVIDTYYFRMTICNVGKTSAKFVEVYAKGLHKFENENKNSIKSFLPMNLMWAHIRKPFMEYLNPGLGKSCDLGYILDPEKRKYISLEEIEQREDLSDKAIFSIDLEVKPFSGGHLIPPGKYEIHIVLGASNAKPVQKVVELEFDGEWHDEEEVMFSKHIKISLH